MYMEKRHCLKTRPGNAISKENLKCKAWRTWLDDMVLRQGLMMQFTTGLERRDVKGCDKKTWFEHRSSWDKIAKQDLNSNDINDKTSRHGLKTRTSGETFQFPKQDVSRRRGLKKRTADARFQTRLKRVRRRQGLRIDLVGLSWDLLRKDGFWAAVPRGDKVL